MRRGPRSKRSRRTSPRRRRRSSPSRTRESPQSPPPADRAAPSPQPPLRLPLRPRRRRRWEWRCCLPVGNRPRLQTARCTTTTSRRARPLGSTRNDAQVACALHGLEVRRRAPHPPEMSLSSSVPNRAPKPSRRRGGCWREGALCAAHCGCGGGAEGAEPALRRLGCSAVRRC